MLPVPSEATLLEPCIDAMPFVSSATALCSKADVDNLLPLKNGIASPLQVPFGISP